MKRIVIAGQDRTEELLAASQGDTAATPPGLCLARSANETEYLSRLLELLRTRDGLRTATFDIPAPPGVFGRLLRLLRRFQWRVFRYQHDRMAFQQNALNGQIVAALEFLREEYRRDLARLETKVAALEAQRAALGGKVSDPSRPTEVRKTEQTVGREGLRSRNLPAASGQDESGHDSGRRA